MVRNIYTCIVGVGVGGKSMRGKSCQLMATVAGGVMGILTRRHIHNPDHIYKQHNMFGNLDYKSGQLYQTSYVIQLARKIQYCLQPITKYISCDICAMLYLVFECSWQAACHV